MRKSGLAVFFLAALMFLVPASAQKTPQNDERAKVCHQCEWLAIQISDIDEKIASWERQTASINKYSNLKDPNIQGALKDIADKIANLKAKKQQLQTELAACQKRCAALSAPPLQPMTPQNPGGGKTGGGGGTGGGGEGGTGGSTRGGTAGGTTPQTPEGEKPCPEKKPAAPINPGGGNTDGVYTPPSGGALPPAPTDKFELMDWKHLIAHMRLALSGFGDPLDVEDVIYDLEDMIDWAYDDLARNPNDAAAEERLRWLRKWCDFFRRWESRLHLHYLRVFNDKVDCPPPRILISPSYKKALKGVGEDSPLYNPGGGSYQPYQEGIKQKSGEEPSYRYQPEPSGEKGNGSHGPDNLPGPNDIPREGPTPQQPPAPP